MPKKGEKMPQWWRDKISKANKGKVNSPEAIKRMAETKRGRKVSKEHRIKISETLKKRGPNKGSFKKGLIPWNKGMEHSAIKAENNCNWDGGDWKYWRIKALERDDYTCQICGLRYPEIMRVDHIKPKSLYPKLKLDLKNMMVLCPNCHAIKSLGEHTRIMSEKKRMNSGKPQTDNAVGNPEPSLEE